MPATRRSPLLTALPLLACAVLLGACASSPPADAPTAAVGGDARVYEVFGMDCPGCHGGLEKLVRRIPGVRDAEASWQDQRVTVTVDPDVEVADDAVRDAIARANFTAGERLE